jgi:hypothetical protein
MLKETIVSKSTSPTKQAGNAPDSRRSDPYLQNYKLKLAQQQKHVNALL